MQHILYADTFVNNSIDMQIGNQDRINTILNETFQLTVRQQIYEEDGEDMDDFRGKLVNSPSPFDKSNGIKESQG